METYQKHLQNYLVILQISPFLPSMETLSSKAAGVPKPLFIVTATTVCFLCSSGCLSCFFGLRWGTLTRNQPVWVFKTPKTLRLLAVTYRRNYVINEHKPLYVHHNASPFVKEKQEVSRTASFKKKKKKPEASLTPTKYNVLEEGPITSDRGCLRVTFLYGQTNPKSHGHQSREEGTPLSPPQCSGAAS